MEDDKIFNNIQKLIKEREIQRKKRLEESKKRLEEFNRKLDTYFYNLNKKM